MMQSAYILSLALSVLSTPPEDGIAERISRATEDANHVIIDSSRDHILWEVLGEDTRIIRRIDFRKKKRKTSRSVRDADLVAAPQTTTGRYGLVYSQFDEDEQRWKLLHNGKEPVSPSAASDIQPSVTPNGKRVAFASGRSGRGDVYIAETNATNRPPKLVAQGTSAELYPQWSPDGKTLAFLRVTVRGSSLVVVSNIDTAPTETVLADERMSPISFSWRPDGQELAFYRRDYSAGASLNVVSVHGGQINRRLVNVKVQPRGPAWLKGTSWALLTVRTDDTLVSVTPVGDIRTLVTETYGHGEIRAGQIMGKQVVVFTALGRTASELSNASNRSVFLWAIPTDHLKGAPNTGLPDFQ